MADSDFDDFPDSDEEAHPPRSGYNSNTAAGRRGVQTTVPSFSANRGALSNGRPRGPADINGNSQVSSAGSSSSSISTSNRSVSSSDSPISRPPPPRTIAYGRPSAAAVEPPSSNGVRVPQRAPKPHNFHLELERTLNLAGPNQNLAPNTCSPINTSPSSPPEVHQHGASVGASGLVNHQQVSSNSVPSRPTGLKPALIASPHRPYVRPPPPPSSATSSVRSPPPPAAVTRMPTSPVRQAQSTPRPPAASIATERWYFGSFDREKAFRKLMNQCAVDGGFLVRPSSKRGQNTPYSLSLMYCGKVHHLEIRQKMNGKFALGSEKEFEEEFDSVQSLVSYHRSHPLRVVNKETQNLSCETTLILMF